MGSTRLQPDQSTRQRASALRKRAQEIVTKVSAFNQFTASQDPKLPLETRAQVLVITTFTKDGLAVYDDVKEPYHLKYVGTITRFLECTWNNWRKIREEEAAIRKNCEYFKLTVIVTTRKRQREAAQNLRIWIPEVLTSRISGFTSDEDFLREIGVAQLNAEVPVRSRV